VFSLRVDRSSRHHVEFEEDSPAVPPGHEPDEIIEF
jgi:hypothetical protein